MRPDDAADFFEGLAVFLKDGRHVLVDFDADVRCLQLLPDAGRCVLRPVFAYAEVEDQIVVFALG